MGMFERAARSQVEAIAAGEVSAEAVVADHLARADAVGDAINAFTQRLSESALAKARSLDAQRAQGQPLPPLAGLCLTVKENLAYPGTPSTVGVGARRSTLLNTTAPLVAAAESLGAIVLGKTNVPQLLLSMESTNPTFGRTNNPWALDRAPGGSSGGEAAAVASGMSAAGIGTDIGGSVRNPAAWCGLAGLKPTWGRWSVYGSSGGQPGQEAVKAVTGPLCRSTDDLIWLWETLDGALQHGLDPAVPPIAAPRVADVDVAGLTVGVFEDDGVFAPAASVRRAVREAADALANAGAKVVPYAPPNGEAMAEAYFRLLSADGLVTAKEVLAGEPLTPQLATLATMARLPRLLRRLLAWGLGVTGETRVARIVGALGEKRVHEVWKLVVLRESFRRAEFAAMAAAGVDVLVGPPTITPAALHDETGDWSLGAWPTMRWNLLDLPAGVVPVSRVRPDETVRTVLADRLDRKAARFELGSEGLPVAAQIAARPWEEHKVLAAMAVVERGVGWTASVVTPR